MTTYPGELMIEKLAELYGVPGGRAALETEDFLTSVRETADEPAVVRRRLTPALYEVVFGYLERMRRAKCAEPQIAEAERIMTDAAYSQLLKQPRRELDDDDRILLIRGAWKWIAEVIEQTEGKKL